jgi:hypothetical protein
MRRGDAPELLEKAQHASVGEEKVRDGQNFRKAKTEQGGKTRFVERQGTQGPGVPRHAQIS